ncbi:heparan-alpha-glucosaminide N-acetyltransferase domain-containing protein [Caulobacter sp. 1776]|uniref:acyltransferase family protein n=1 Tax=Caulobacter sp. 1776 TaxID=3156420 RepID=UPI00339689DC
MAARQPGQRMVALDFLRGLAVAGMILVVSPGSWEMTYAPLKHAAWRGWTPADLVFPTFLYCVGMAIGLMVPRLASADRGGSALWLKVARRTGLLILLGLVLNALPDFNLAHLRIPGILQRIALCYALATAICVLAAGRGEDGRLRFNLPVAAVAAAALLALYWALLAFAPVPGFGPGHLDSNGSLPAYIDRVVFTVPHLWPYGTTEGVGVTYDPEGLLSTLPATVNVLVGAIVAHMTMRSDRKPMPVLALGAALIIAGLALDPLMPIVKRIWTPSFALLSGGISTVAFVGLDLLSRSRRGPGLGFVPIVLGGNAILGFILSQLLSAFGGMHVLRGANPSPQGFVYALTQKAIADPYLASLACAVLVLALITAILIPLHKRGIHLRL